MFSNAFRQSTIFYRNSNPLLSNKCVTSTVNTIFPILFWHRFEAPICVKTIVNPTKNYRIVFVIQAVSFLCFCAGSCVNILPNIRPEEIAQTLVWCTANISRPVSSIFFRPFCCDIFLRRTTEIICQNDYGKNRGQFVIWNNKGQRNKRKTRTARQVRQVHHFAREVVPPCSGSAASFRDRARSA